LYIHTYNTRDNEVRKNLEKKAETGRADVVGNRLTRNCRAAEHK